MKLMTSNWQLRGQLARVMRDTESQGAMAVLLAHRVHPMPCGEWLCPNTPFARQPQGRNGDWLPSPHGPVPGLPTRKQQHWVPHNMPNSSANSVCTCPLRPPKAVGHDTGGELRRAPPLGLPGSPSPAAVTLHLTRQATSLNTYSFKDYSNVAHF